MNITKLFSLFAFVTLAVLSLGLASATTIFSDGFESGTVGSAPNGWAVTPTSGIALPQTPWIVSSTNPASGSNNAEAKPGASSNQIMTLMEKTISTIGYTNIVISYNKSLGDTWESSDIFNASWTVDGITFNNLELVSGSATSGYVSTTIPISSTSANNNANFKIRFECTTNATAEFCRLDDFNVSGTPIPTVSNLTMSASAGPFSTNQNATLTVTNTGNTNFGTITLSEITTPLLFSVTFNPTTISSLNAGNSSTIMAVLNSLTNLKFGLNTVNVQASTGTGTGSQTATTSFQIKKTFCSAGETLNNNLTIANIDWSNNGEGDHDSWELLDEVEVEVKVENHNRDDNVDAIVELGLFDSNGNNQADNLVFLADSDGEDEQIDININDDDEETVTFKFKVPADFDTGNYKLAIKVFDDDAGESRSCRDSSSDFAENSFFKTIDVKQTSDEGKYVVVDEISMDSQVACGQSVSGQFTVFNVGKDDQDRVKITIRNKDLKINEVREITSDLDQGDDETLDFSIDIPATATNGNYNLEFITEYDYRNGVYREESDDSFDYTFEVLGCSQNLASGTGALTNLEISAKLDSEAQAGKELIVKAIIKNTGDKSADYTLSANGYSDWAELTDISDTSLSVDAGESKEVIFKLLVNSDAAGIQTFDIQVASQGKVQIQEVEVELSEGKSLLNFNFGNPLIWVIVLVNIVLIVLIIVVAVKLSKR